MEHKAKSGDRVIILCFTALASRWSFVGVSLVFFCPKDYVPDNWQPRSILLGMIEARSVNKCLYIHLTCCEAGSDVHVLIKEFAMRRVEQRLEIHSN